MARFHPAVAADVKIPALFSRNNPDVFTLRFGTFAGTARDRHFDFVRRAQPLVTMFKPYRQPR